MECLEKAMNIRRITKAVLTAPVEVARGAWDALDETVNGKKDSKK